jgi:hypothetical protein
MVHSVKNRKKREKAMSKLKKTAKRWARLGSHHKERILEMKLPYVALGDLRRKWKQTATILHPALLRRFKRFKRIKIPKDKPLRILGSDGGLLIYGVALNNKALIHNLYESIQAAPEPKHYMYKGKKRSDYRSWHWTAWAKYNLVPFMSREYLDAQEEADKFFEDNKEVFSQMSKILGQCAPGVFKQFQTYPLPDGVKRLCGAWSGCAINKGGNNPNETNRHRDASEAQYGYSGLISCGDYQAGGLILWELEVVLETDSGDVVIFPDAIINHSNERAKGTRSSAVCFTQENIYNYWNRRYNMKLRRKGRRRNNIHRTKGGKVIKS